MAKKPALEHGAKPVKEMLGHEELADRHTAEFKSWFRGTYGHGHERADNEELAKGLHRYLVGKKRDSVDHGTLYFMVAEELGLPVRPFVVSKHDDGDVPRGKNVRIIPALLHREGTHVLSDPEQGKFDARHEGTLADKKIFLVRALSHKGITLAEDYKYKEALEHLDHAISIDPTHAHAWANKGQTLEWIGEEEGSKSRDEDDEHARRERQYYEDAYTHYERAIELDPTHANAWYHKANMLFRYGRLADAMKSFDEALRHNPGHTNALNAKGYLLAETGRKDEALEHYDRAIAIDPNLAHAFYNKGHILLEQGQHRAAIEAFKRVLNIERDDPRPEHPDAKEYLLEATLAMKRR